ncbi:helix-turn-helix transcriptional regulator [Streptomyces winkii]|uniref:helix-turn-helix transcriptional regulator n=1 Tax=Streptomyces winkii TaxID=3051178 RepID=UPI0028D1422A|nr:AAA family ATPase [Streptomyces sp. DSM 40971]
MLWGRGAEQAAIDGMLAAGRGGAGGALVLVGEPGAGKTELLAFARSRAGDLRVLHARGSEAESVLPYAAVHQLLHPVLDGMGQLPEPQADALSIALGRKAGPAPDRFLVSTAVLTLLSDLGGERPVLCLVDELHWVDEPSAQVLAFVARRLGSEPVVLLAASRHGEPAVATGMEELRLRGLAPGDSAKLLDARWGEDLSPAVRDRLVAATGGNPLALAEIPGTLTERQLHGRDALPDPLPLAGELERVFSRVIRQRDPAERSLLLLCAAQGPGDLATIRRAAGALGVGCAPLESEELAGFVRVEGSTVVFRHPLVRAAAYHDAAPHARRAAHAALAGVLADHEREADRRAWHLSQAADGPDENVARELERSAGRALRRSGHGASATALERAAELSPDEPDRARRLAAAADAAWTGGDLVRARGLADRADQLSGASPAVELRMRYLRGMIELRGGVATDSLAILLSAADKAAESDPRLCVRILVSAGEAAFLAGDAAAAREVDRLMARLPHTGEGRDRVLARLFLAVAPVSRGESPASLASDLRRAEETGDPYLLVRAGGLAFARGDYDLARRLRTRGTARARSLGAAGTLAWALWYQANDEMLRGRYAHAEALVSEGHDLAAETGQPNLGWQHQATRTALAAVRGRGQEARRLAGEVTAQAGARRLATAGATVRSALARLALAEGDGQEAALHLETMRGLMSTSHHRVSLTVIPDHVEAAVRAGLPEQAHELYARFMPRDTASAPAQARALTARTRALVTDGDEADRSFREALRLHAEVDLPLDRARTVLLYGEFLRRRKRRADARTRLRAALEEFELLGAAAWARRAREELRATGETVRRRDPHALESLTPKELQVVEAVGQGHTNREAAAQLFISPRTVDDHLRKVFRKLGISSRTELVRLALTGDGVGDSHGDDPRGAARDQP